MLSARFCELPPRTHCPCENKSFRKILAATNPQGRRLRIHRKLLSLKRHQLIYGSNMTSCSCLLMDQFTCDSDDRTNWVDDWPGLDRPCGFAMGTPRKGPAIVKFARTGASHANPQQSKTNYWLKEYARRPWRSSWPCWGQGSIPMGFAGAVQPCTRRVGYVAQSIQSGSLHHGKHVIHVQGDGQASQGGPKAAGSGQIGFQSTLNSKSQQILEMSMLPSQSGL